MENFIFCAVWLVPNEPQEYVKHETNRILTQKDIQKKTYRKKSHLILENINKKLKILVTQ